MQVGLGDSKFVYQQKKIGTKLQRQDTHRLNIFIGDNMIKMDGAVYNTAWDLERFSIVS